ncbi:MAG: hypothetical protein IKB65_08055 [Ruminiclostridium sp.]|nr:hypothetical protein [Ruminiclostridium sp.]
MRIMMLRPCRNDVMFAKIMSEATSFPKEPSLAQPASFANGKHHSKKPLLSVRQKWLFCWWTIQDLNL